MYIQNKKSVTLAAAIATVLAVGSTNALAYDAGDMIIRGGLASVMPNDDSTPLNVNGDDVADSGAEVEDDTQLGISFTYMMSPKFGIEVLGATPFTHDVKAKTGALGLGTVGAAEVSHLPPTIAAQYYFMDKNSAFQPYVGAGINVTVFFDEEIHSDLEGVLGEGDLSLDESVGLALQAGMDYAINDTWGVNAAVWYIDISTDAEFKFDSGTVVKTTVDIDPTVFMLGASYRF